MMKLSRNEYRQLKAYSKEELERWLHIQYSSMYDILRKEFNNNYKDELDSSVQNFITAIAYTLHFNEEVNLKQDELASFMNDLFVSVEMFRKGEYNPEDYREQLREDGIEIAKYDYDKLYREKDMPHKNKCDEIIKFLSDDNIEKLQKEDIINKVKSILEKE